MSGSNTSWMQNPNGVVKAYGDHAINPANQVSTINFGIVHVGDVVDSGYSIGNIAWPGAYPLLGSITPYNLDSRLSGAGYINQNFTVGPGGNFNDYRVALDATSAGAINSDVNVGFYGFGDYHGAHNIAITGEVLNYADPHFMVKEGSSQVGLPLSQWGNVYYADLGDIQRGTHFDPVKIDILNAALGPSDVLTGGVSTWATGGSLHAHGSGSFSALGAGQQTNPLTTINVSSGRLGRSVAVVDLRSTASNAGGYTATEPDRFLVVTDNVVSSLA